MNDVRLPSVSGLELDKDELQAWLPLSLGFLGLFPAFQILVEGRQVRCLPKPNPVVILIPFKVPGPYQE